MDKILNYIGGEYYPTPQYFDTYNPSQGKAIAQIPDSGVDDINHAVDCAKKAFPQWKQTSFCERAEILKRLAKLIEEHAQTLAEIESRDQGKPLHLASNMDIPRCSLNFSFFASAIEQLNYLSTQENDCINYVRREPYGVVGLITPWNLPLYLLTWKLAPALAMGNTVVCKPSELTSMTAFYLTKLFDQAGLPKGVCNMVFGKGNSAGAALVSHPDVPCISFTGGTKTGLDIYTRGAQQFKKVSLELGGKNPQMVFADADLDSCIEKSISACFLNQGEICLCTSRLFVEKTIFDSFLDKFVKRASQLKTGNPQNKENFLGAVVSKEHLNKILSFIEIAKKEGGQIHLGGQSIKGEGDCEGGYFMPPTIISNLSPQSPVMQEEIFGPVVVLHPFENEEEAIRLSNEIRYGLAASIWTQNLSKAHRVAQSVQAGQVWVNTWLRRDLRVPFGGMKESGVGREGGLHSLDSFSQYKNICIQI